MPKVIRTSSPAENPVPFVVTKVPVGPEAGERDIVAPVLVAVLVAVVVDGVDVALVVVLVSKVFWAKLGRGRLVTVSTPTTKASAVKRRMRVLIMVIQVISWING